MKGSYRHTYLLRYCKMLCGQVTTTEGVVFLCIHLHYHKQTSADLLTERKVPLFFESCKWFIILFMVVDGNTDIKISDFLIHIY